MIINLLAAALLLVVSTFSQPVTLLARIGKTISHLKIDPVTLHLSDSRILYKPIGEELQVSVAVDSRSSSGFFTLGQDLHRYNLNGSSDSSQLRVGGVLDDTPTAIAYDWLTNKIYVALSTIGPDNSARIEVCDDVKERKTDGGCAVILHEKLDYLHSLVLDPKEGNMYWINAVQNQIERSFMNGQHHDQHPFLNPAAVDVARLTSLTLSSETNSLFYVRTTKDGSELWQCRLYERQSCMKFFETAHVLHVDVHGKYLFLSLSSGRLAVCEQTHCAGTFHEVEQLTELEVFQVVHDENSSDKSSATNPCAVNNGGCSHVCLVARIEPKRTCACPIGVRLKDDGIKCEDGFNEVLLISAITGLFYISLDTSDYTPQAIPYQGHEESSHSLFDVDYDHVEGFVYWLDITDTAIKRCRLNGSDLSVIAREEVQQSAKTFRLDVFGRNIFWVDGETALIWIGKMDGSLAPRVLDVSIKLENPHGIAIDSIGGVLYVTDWFERSSRIVRMNLDGSDAQVFYALQDFSYPTGIDLDLEGGRLYWAESNHSLIRSIKLDSTDLLSYMQASYKLVQPYSVSKLGNRIFCNSMAGRSFVEIVLRDGILAGHDFSRVVESQIYGPVGLRAVRLNEPAKKSGPCAKNNGGCSHYCLNTPSIARCLCARGFELQKDGRRCVRSTSSIIILDSFGRRPDLVRMAIKGPRNLERLHLQDLSGSPHDIAFDELSSSIFIASSNDSSGSIERINLTSATPRATVVVSGVALRGISHLAIESHSKLIVYSNAEFGKIEVCSLDGKHTKTLAWIGIRPTIIKLDSDRSEIYYVNESLNQSSIRRIGLAVDSKGGEILYKTSQSTTQIVAIAVDSKGEVIYWTEQIRGINTLHKMRTNGNGSEVLSRSEDRRISHLHYKDNALYYIDSKKNEFGFYDGSGFHSVHAGVKSVRDFIITHLSVKKETKRPCEVDNGGCTELCLPQVAQGTEVCTCGDHRYYESFTKLCQANPHGIIMASNGRFFLTSAKDANSMLNQDHSPITSLPIEKVGLPLSVCVDELSRFATLYWIDANEPKFIRSVPTRGAYMMNPQPLNVAACIHLRALTVDTYGRQLFVSCVVSSGRSHVMVFRIQSSSALLPDKLLHIGRVVNGDGISTVTGKQPVPTELAVGAGKLAYLDVSTRSGGPILVVCDLDGRNCDKASERTTPYSRLSLIPKQNKLLFTGEESINRLDLTSLNTVPISNGPLNVKALFASVDGDKVAFVPIDEKDDPFLVIGNERLFIPGMARVSAIASFTVSEFSLIDRSRSCMHQECTHLCTYTGDSFQCLCPLGYTISHESSNICMQNVSCEPWEFLCRDQRTCVHSGAKCDNRLNCPDGSDETNELCGAVDSKTWTCANKKTRIDRYLVCDGVAHCDDESDETGCKCNTPSSEMDCAIFGRMSQPECVLRKLRCDHHYDCSNGADEDERLCSTFSPEIEGFRITFAHIMFCAIVLLILLALCPICIFFCYSKKMTRGAETAQTIPDRRYHFAAQNDPTLLVPLSTAPAEHYELRAYSVVESTSTYPSLPPPIPSLCGSTNRSGFSPHYLPQQSRDHPSRFYAPPPSTASLSTYGIVVPSYNTGTASQRRIIITEHAIRSPSSRSGISPPPAYLVQSQLNSRLPVKGRKTSSKDSPQSSNKKELSSRSRLTLNRSQSSSDKSEHDSVSLSSHSSEGAPISTRQQL